MTKLDSSKRIEGKMLTDMDKNNSNEDNSNMDMEMERMSNYTEDWLGRPKRTCTEITETYSLEFQFSNFYQEFA